ncbi:MAG TPA: aldo/keto reductase [Solirubrobacterales bacterium]|nr:aldo/keto reductase [Solirubrobacterales bacterium]
MTETSPSTPLPTRRLGDSELQASAVGLGCNNFGARLDADGTAAVLEAALDAGITFFDTADVYGGAGASEELMGAALMGRRDEFLIATKFGWKLEGAEGVPDAPSGSREYIRWAVEGSLRRLQVDRIDLYQYHRPDMVTPLAETLAALDELMREGVVRAIGCSNVSAAEIEEAERAAREGGLARFVTVQNEYSLLQRGIESVVAPACERFGTSILPFFPLAKGLLTGKYRRGETGPEGTRLAGQEAGSEEQFETVERLQDFAEARGLGLVDVAIAGLAAQPAVGSVIAGATRPEQVRANVAALRWQPSPEDLAELDRITPSARP